MSVTNGPRRGVMINALTGDGFDSDFRKLLCAIDALLAGAVINLTTSAPPGSPTNGDAYVVKATGTGAWAGHDKAIAVWTTDNPAAPSGEWEFYAAGPGMILYSIADNALTAYSTTSSSWVGLAGGGSSTLAADTDVVIASPANNDVLTYETSSTKWKNKPAASGFSNPMTTLGDLIAGGSSGAAARLGVGSAGQVLTVVSGAPAWAAGGGGGGGGGAAFTFDGSSLTGWTTGGGGAGVSAFQLTSGFSPHDFIHTLHANPNSYAYKDTGLSSLAGTIIEFDIASEAMGSSPLCDFRFGCDSLGNGPSWRVDGRGGANSSGISSSSTWGSAGAPGAGENLSPATWYHIKLVLAGTVGGDLCTWHVNGVVRGQTLITLNGTFVGFFGDGGAQGGYLANLRIYTS